MARAQRSDASRNREALLDAAASAFSTDGVEASLEKIAKNAGVGIGTLYRHFPTRNDLVAAVYRHNVDLLCASADRLAAELPPDEALAQWVQELVVYVAGKRGMAAYIKTMVDADTEIFASAKASIKACMDRLLGAAVAAGTMRGDVDAHDLFRAIGGVCVMSDDPDGPSHGARMAALLVDGLRYRA